MHPDRRRAGRAVRKRQKEVRRARERLHDLADKIRRAERQMRYYFGELM